MTIRVFMGAAAILVAATLIAGDSFAQTILYSDDFEGRTLGSGDPNNNPGGVGGGSSDWGDNNNALGGSLTFTYSVGAMRAGGCNQVVDGMVGSTCNGIVRTQTDILSMAPNGFSIALDFQRDHQYNNLPGVLDPAGNGYMSIGLGNSTDPSNSNPDTNVDSNTDFTFLFQQEVLPNEGNTQFLEDGVLIAPAMGGDPGPIDYGNPAALHSVIITLVPQTPGAYGDSDDIDFTVVVDGDAVNKSFSSTVKGGDDFGMLSLSSNMMIHRAWDNLVVTALAVTGNPSDTEPDGDVDGQDFLVLQRTNPSGIAAWQGSYPAPLAGVNSVPEPGALALVATSGLMLAVRRRRSSTMR